MSFDRDAEQQIDRICMEYEDELKAGRQPRIEDYLTRVAPLLLAKNARWPITAIP